MDSDWISVKDRLPLEDGNSVWNVIGEYMVTVELDYDLRDGNDEKGVMMLWFDATKQIWFDFETWKEYNWGWSVTHWQEKPKPAK